MNHVGLRKATLNSDGCLNLVGRGKLVRLIQVSEPVDFSDCDNSRFGYREPARLVFFEVVTNLNAFRDGNSLVDDGAANFGVSTNVDSGKED